MDNSQWLRNAGPVIRRADHPHDLSQLDWAVSTGSLVAVLPGVYMCPDLAGQWQGKLAALVAWRPDAVVIGAAAAKLHFWPGLAVPVVEAAVETRCRREGFRFARRRVPLDQVIVRNGMRICSPAVACLDLVPQWGGDVIDRALRSRQVTLSQLWEALENTTNRRGNTHRRWLLLDSRGEPWSEAERMAHRLLREGRIAGWRANRLVVVDGRKYFLDIAFDRQRVAVEIDGRLHEDSLDLFESDRERQNALVLAGWTVLRFTWHMLLDRPDEVIKTIHQALQAGDRRQNSGNRPLVERNGGNWPE